MSLNLSNPSAMAYNSSDWTLASAATLALSNFDGGDVDNAESLILFVDCTGGAFDATTIPTSLTNSLGAELIVSGVTITIVKVDATSNRVTFTDPVTSRPDNHVNMADESITLMFNGTDWMNNY